MRTEGLWLVSDSLLSKWGFDDGDRPEELLDEFDERDEPYPRNWHAILTGLVRDFLLPALDQRVTVREYNTIHNPIRAETIDGAPVDDAVIYGDALEPTLTPGGVLVPWDVVVERSRRQAQDSITKA